MRVYPALLIALFVFSAFRFEVGCDWTGYLNQFEFQQFHTFKDTLTTSEPLWWALLATINQLGLSYPWLNVVSSAIFFAGVHVFARRQPDPVGFLILLFPILIINMPMSGIRQGAAIGVICVAFTAFLDRRLYQFVGLVLLASTLHTSAAIFLLLVPLARGRYTKSRLALSALLALPGGLALLSRGEFQLALSRYVNTGIDAAGASFRVGLLAITGIFFFSILRRKWERWFPHDYPLVSIGALMMLAITVLIPLSSVISDRLGYYLVPLQAMIFARIPYMRLGRFATAYSVAPYIGLSAVFAIWTSKSWIFEICYLPYETWLFGFPESTTSLR
ncbi:EpsG family protein [Hoeflea sp. TYP-13]|uniref:EpsG family protein n=1 Tax=Hoeflea sp. TYP-13 TaxID=3230023 RepID=UPI0034C60C03